MLGTLVDYSGSIRAVVLDWAGTVIDFGSRAPAQVFVEVFKKHGVDVTTLEAREPMGMAKRAHIAAVLGNPAVADRWSAAHGQLPGEQEIEALYADFQVMQLAVLPQYSTLIPGALEAVQQLRDRGIRIGSATGYTTEMMKVVAASAADQGYTPDAMVCASDTEVGRPSPWLVFENMRRLDVFPPAAVVVVDDTVAGVQSGQNAGAWSVGVAATGNLVGLSQAELNALTAEEQRKAVKNATELLKGAGAHFVIPSLADLPAIVSQIESK